MGYHGAVVAVLGVVGLANDAQALRMRFSHYDWDTNTASQLYTRVPYGRLGGYFPDAHKYMAFDRQPLYFDPRDPKGSAPNPKVFNFTDPYRGAGYLPRALMGRNNALYPTFGHVPVNYVSPFYHPTWPGGAYGPPQRFSHPEGFMGIIPTEVPFPGWTGGMTHPVYASWYTPGIAMRRVDRNIGATMGPLADRPAPMMKYRVERPIYMDRPSAWPSIGTNDPYSSVPRAPPSPPPDSDAAPSR